MLIWNSSLVVGFDVVDSQHERLFRRINDLLKAIREGKGPDEIAVLIKFLELCFAEHFSTEEQLMASRPELDFGAHKSQHEVLKRALAHFNDRYQVKGASAKLTPGLQHNLWEWLRSHMLITDRKLACLMMSRAAAKNGDGGPRLVPKAV